MSRSKQVYYQFKVTQVIPEKFVKATGELKSTSITNVWEFSYKTSKPQNQDTAIANACAKLNFIVTEQIRMQELGVNVPQLIKLSLPITIEMKGKIKFNSEVWSARVKQTTKVKRGNKYGLFQVINSQARLFKMFNSTTEIGSQFLTDLEKHEVVQRAEIETAKQVYRDKVKKAKQAEKELSEAQSN